ncbi:dihydropteroate synthase [Lactococcus termiticola]|uniref:Dihydropteroate synthase n=1 Tax=Lactococcus termiticola TaxID=2169526 RepID=A0A2R5HGF0_9LACT|nr:dihydropteroate synthase [Lactococcus termiticola]GBG97062.1 dihydropteroate synthase [Lactococcus termiticola]
MKISAVSEGKSLSAIPIRFEGIAKEELALKALERHDKKAMLTTEDCLAFFTVFELEQLLKSWSLEAGKAELEKILKAQTVQWSGQNFSFDLTLDPIVYAILNVTPDSFFDGAEANLSVDNVLKKASYDLEKGASVLELGGKSSRPGYEDISPEEEWSRLKAVIPAIKQEFPQSILAVDTDEAYVMERVLDAGVDIINDIDGFDTEEKLKIIESYKPAVVVMNNGRAGFSYADNVFDELALFFENKEKELLARGLKPENIVLDAGVGFWTGDSGSDSVYRIKATELLSRQGLPVMVAISRKSYMTNIFEMSPGERLFGSLIFAREMIEQGGRVLRVHDVAETQRLIKGNRLYHEF